MTEKLDPGVARDIGRRIRALREATGMSLSRLAEVSGVSRRMLTHIELGQANPSIGTVDKVAAALGTTFPGLLGVVDHAPPSGVQIWSTPADSWAYLLRAVETRDLSVELWRLRLVGDEVHSVGATAGAPDSMLHVLEGSVRVATGERESVVTEGHSGTLDGESEHRLTAVTPVAAFLRVVMVPRAHH
ncbi:helix-turn-helix domain-containing protein [Streptomyces spiramenti]|uniref:Helix-turn-helix transcriptional regulator n=1 Tax=Streptomyces spiramenti TaxID=2720606 RepID=A0ABX1AD78_9ACTN|nr:helix-turn-helix transcriptional regulator [Streptomyces spiramenti]